MLLRVPLMEAFKIRVGTQHTERSMGLYMADQCVCTMKSYSVSAAQALGCGADVHNLLRKLFPQCFTVSVQLVWTLKSGV